MALRDENGRFVPGHGGAPGAGRPKRQQEQQLSSALAAQYPPSYVQEKIDRAMELAENQKSSRGSVNVLRFIAEYTEGLPVKRVMHIQDGYDRLAALMRVVQAERTVGAEDEVAYTVEESTPEDAAFKELIDASENNKE